MTTRVSNTSAIEQWLPCRACQNPPIVCDRIVGRKPIALVLDYPTNLEKSKGRLLQGDTGKLIRATLKTLGVDERDVNVITALNCKPPTAKPKLLRESMACCRARLLRELRSLNVEKVLCLGTIGYTALTSTDKIARMDKVHGRWMPVYGMWMIGTYSPTRVIMDPELYRDWIKAFVKFFDTDKREPWPDIRMYVPSTTRELRDNLESIGGFDSKYQLSLDIETTGFSPIEDEVVAVGFGAMRNETDGDIVIIDYELLQDERTWWMIADQLEFGWNVPHNGKFDLKFIVQVFRKLGIDFRIGKIDDTLLENYCLDERPWGRYGAHSLKNISRVRYDAPDYDINVGEWIKLWKQAKRDGNKSMLDALEKTLHTYLALDCYYTARLGRDLPEEIKKESKRLYKLYRRLLIPASNMLSAVELRGCNMDKHHLLNLREQLLEQIHGSTEIIRDFADDDSFNPASTKQIYSLLYDALKLPITTIEHSGRHKGGPTSAITLKRLRAQFPEYADLFNEILTWRRLQNTLGTYVNGLLNRIDPDGRLRPDFLLHGTATGRLSSLNPNAQNIPEKTHTIVDLRAAFIPTADDWVLIDADYSQLELRVAAHVSKDPNFVEVYREGRDLHQRVLTLVFGRTDASHYERWLAKGMVFGAMYARTAKAMVAGPEMDYLVNELGGEPWPLAKMQAFFDAFFAEYTELAKWQANAKKEVYKKQMLETEMGRIRRFPFISSMDKGSAGRMAINTPFQSLASDINLDAAVRIHERLERINRKAGKTLAHIILLIHDSVIAEAHESVSDQVQCIMREEMENVPIDTEVPFKVNIAVAKNWGDCHD